MNVGTLTVSMALRTVGAVQSLNTFESGVLASVSRMNARMASLGRTFTYAVSSPILIGGAQAIKMFSEFEYTMAKIVGLAGVQATQVQAWTKDVIQLSIQTGKSAKELAEGLYFVASSGIKGGKALDVLKISALGAMTGMGKTADIANLLTSVINAYGAENISATRTMDVLTAAIREGKAEAVDMAKALGYVVNVAAEMDISFENVAAAVAATTRTGASASTSVTQLRQLLFSFIKERPQVEKALTLVGLEYQQVRDWMKEDLLTGLVKLDAVMEEWGVETLGKIFPNVRALNEFLALTGKNVVENTKVFQAVKNSMGDFKSAIDAVANTAQVRLNSALQLINASFIKFGAVLAQQAIPLIQKFAQFISDLIGWFTALNPEVQNFILMAGTLGAVLGPALIALSSSLSALLGMMNMLLNPIGLVLALAAAIMVVVRNLEYWEKAWPRMMEQMKKGGLWILKIVNTIAYAIQGTFSDIFNAFAAGNPTNPLINGIATALDVSTDNISKRGVEIQNMIDDINTSLNGFSPETFIDKYNTMLQTLGGIHPKQRNSMISIMKRATAASLVMKEYNPDTAKADPNLAYGAGDAVLASLKAELKKAMDWIGELSGQMFGKFGGSGVGLNIGGPNNFDDILKEVEKGNVKIKDSMEKATVLKMYEQGRMKPFFGMTSSAFESFGFSEEQIKEIDAANRVMEHIADLKEKGRAGADAYRKYLAEAKYNYDVATLIANTLEPLRIQNEMLEKQSELMYGLTWEDKAANANQGLAEMLKLQSELSEMRMPMDDSLLAKLQSFLLLTDEMAAKVSQVQFVENTFQSLAGVISTSLLDIENGFKGFIQNLGKFLAQMVSQLIAAAAASFLLVTIMSMIPGFGELMAGSSIFKGLGEGAGFGDLFKAAFGAFGGVKLAHGGIIGPGYPNDTFRAELSSKEAIIPLERMPQMLGLRKNRASKNYLILENHVAKALVNDADNLKFAY